MNRLARLCLVTLCVLASVPCLDAEPRPTPVSERVKAPAEDTEWMSLEGSMGSEPKIEMILKRTGSQLAGSYIHEYEGQMQELQLRGTIDARNHVTLDEAVREGWNTAAFEGQLVPKRSFEGVWTRWDGREKLPFALVVDTSKPLDLAAMVDGDYVHESPITVFAQDPNGGEVGTVSNCLRIRRIDRHRVDFSLDAYGAQGARCSMSGEATAVADGFEFRDVVDADTKNPKECVLKLRVSPKTKTIFMESPRDNPVWACPDWSCMLQGDAPIVFAQSDRDFTHPECPQP